jgi:hypothetical protein
LLDRARLSVLALTKKQLGSLDRVSRVMRSGVHIAATSQFNEHAEVADASLPFGSPVELEVILKVKMD